MSSLVAAVTCSVLSQEVARVMQQENIGVELESFDSMLHMRPGRLQLALEARLTELRRPCLVICGECGPSMSDLESRHLCARTRGLNCGELLLGPTEYRAWRRQRAFLLLPEWTGRWREVFEKELGFQDTDLARRFLKEHHDLFVYLDTGIAPVPEATLEEISRHFDLPIRSLPVPLDHLAAALREALARLEERAPQ